MAVFHRDIDNVDIVAEIERRDAASAVIKQLRSALLPGFQRKVFDDRSPLIATLSPRRQGKTYAHIARLVRCAHKGWNAAYIAKTHKSAKKIAWQIIRHVCQAANIKFKENLTDLSVSVGTGMVSLYGADNNNFRDALRGQDLGEIVVDEAGHFLTDLGELLREVIIPCTATMRGSVLITGTPYVIPKGLFFDVTGGNPPGGWSIHELHDPFYNPHTKEGVQRIFKQLEDEFGPDYRELNWYRREWEARWAYDLSANVYKFDASRNMVRYDEVPEFRPGRDEHLLGLDFAWTGNTGLGLIMSSEGITWVKETMSLSNVGMDQADKLLPVLVGYNKAYGGLKIVYDHAQEFIATKLKQLEPSLTFIPATKTEKVQAIEFFNADMQADPPRVRVVGGKNEALITEWVNSEWKKNRHGSIVTSRPKEKGKRDVSDSVLYAWRESRHHRWRSAPPKETPVSDLERIRILGDRDLERRLRQNRRGNKPPGYYL